MEESYLVAAARNRITIKGEQMVLTKLDMSSEMLLVLASKLLSSGFFCRQIFSSCMAALSLL